MYVGGTLQKLCLWCVPVLLTGCVAALTIPPANSTVPPLAACLKSQTDTEFAEGYGTAASPYIICTSKQLLLIGSNTSYLSANFRLGRDLDFSTVSSGDVTPIGSYNYSNSSGVPFSGVLDGDNRTIKNFVINNATADQSVGLFAYSDGAKFKKVTLANFTVVGTRQVGALVGRSRDTDFDSIVIRDLSVNATQTDSNAGGLTAMLETVNRSASVTNILVSGTVRGANSVGGVVGALLNNGANTLTLTDAQFVGDIRVASAVSVTVNGFGGVVGLVQPSVGGSTYILRRLSASGTMVGGSLLGGVVGYVLSTVAGTFTLSDFSADNGLNYDASKSYAQNNFGGLIGRITLTEATLTFDRGVTSGTIIGTDTLAGGMGNVSAGNGATITLSDIHSSRDIDYVEALGNTFAGFAAYLAANSTVATGTLTVQRCSSTGNIRASGSWNGGFAGTITSSGTGSVIVQDSFASGTLTGTGERYTTSSNSLFSGYNQGGFVGNLVGRNTATLIVRRVRANTNLVVGSPLANRAGQALLVGELDRNSAGTIDISDCYAAGSLTSSVTQTGAGGLIGRYTGGGGATFNLSRCYADATLTLPGGSTAIGGLIGTRASVTVTDSFWNSTAYATGIGSGVTTGVTGLTTAQTRAQASFTNFNFTTIWNIVEGVSTPTLR